MRFLVVFTFLVFSQFSFAQVQITGIVANKESQRAIPFVNIALPNGLGSSSDIDGAFAISVPQLPTTLTFTCIGFADTVITVTNTQPITLFLYPKAVELKNVVVTDGPNPAIAIIKNAIANKHINNPEKSTNFSYETYNKMAFGPNVTDQNFIDSVATSAEGDTSYANYLTAMNQHYLFFTESVTKRNFKLPNTAYEKVIANRFSGLKHPTFTLIASAFQPFSFYQDFVTILSLKYVSPLARNSFKNYDFDLVNTQIVNTDTLFTITFQPKEKSTINGLTGTLTISSNKYAIQNIRVDQANEESNTIIHLEQMSAFIDNTQWFPVQFNTHIVFLSQNEDNSMPGLDVINGRGKTYIKNIQLNPTFTDSDFSNVILEIADSAHLQSDTLWNTYRQQPLTAKETTTYLKVDSIGEKHNLDNKLKFFEGLTTGLIPVGKVSLMMKDFVDYNDYEGIRIGIGIRTNNKLSKYFSVGGYTGYGFADHNWKFGTDIKFNIAPKSDVFAGAAYMYDVVPSGDAEFHMKEPFNLRSYTNLFLRRMDWREGVQLYVNARMFKDVQANFFVNKYNEWFTYNYLYLAPNEQSVTTNEVYNRTEIGSSIRFGFKEKYIRSFNQNISLGTKFPYLYGRIAYAHPSIGANYEYLKVDMKIIKTFQIKGAGDLGFSLKAGKTFGNAPAPFLYYSKGMTIDGFNLYIENAFNTMRPNEFLNDKYVSIHLHHKFGALFKSKFSAPQISVVSAAGWGTIHNPEYHQQIEFKTMQKGYFESGLVLDKILISNTSGIGLGAFYRYGEYALPRLEDNFSYRISLSYVLQ